MSITGLRRYAFTIATRELASIGYFAAVAEENGYAVPRLYEAATLRHVAKGSVAWLTNMVIHLANM